MLSEVDVGAEVELRITSQHRLRDQSETFLAGTKICGEDLTAFDWAMLSAARRGNGNTSFSHTASG